jgi:hypothetical protein
MKCSGRACWGWCLALRRSRSALCSLRSWAGSRSAVRWPANLHTHQKAAERLWVDGNSHRSVRVASSVSVSLDRSRIRIDLATTSSRILHLQSLAFLSFVPVLLVPTTLMGATLPVLAAALVRSSGRDSNSVTRLYACNLAGAILGTLAAGFVLLPLLGVRTTIAVAAALNVVVGVIAIVLQRRAQSHPEDRGGRRS